MKKLLLFFKIKLWLLSLSIILLAWCWLTAIQKEKEVAIFEGILEEKVINEEVIIEKIIEIKEVEEQSPKILIVTAKFTQEFVDKYQYEDSRWYHFALYLGDWHYYNVFRNEAGWVANSKKHWLTWAVPAFKFKEGYTRYIPITWQIKVSRKKSEYWYIFIDSVDIKQDEIRLSSVKEWVQIADIKTWVE